MDSSSCNYRGSRAESEGDDFHYPGHTGSGSTLKSDQMKTETDEQDSLNHDEQRLCTAVKIEPERLYQMSQEQKTNKHGDHGDLVVNTTQVGSDGGYRLLDTETGTAENLSKYGALEKKSDLQVHVKFSEGVNLKNNSETNCGYKPYICEDSGKSSVTSEGQHKIYTCRPHSCPDCGKHFRKSGNLKRHQLIHQRVRPKVNTGEEPYSCSDCGKSFCHLGNLKQHQITHTDESYSCTVCGKIFFRLGTLERHQLLHTGERLYSCNECGKSFTHLGSLHTHQRIHKGGKTYICTECGQRFYRLGSLKEHQRVHTIEKEYTCIICGDSFSHLGHFKQHEQVHTKETLFMP